MLKILDDRDKKPLLDFCFGSVLGTRISCYALSYGFHRGFISFWGEFKDEKLVTAVVLFDDALTVISSDETDLSELSQFLDMLSWQSLTATTETAEALGFTDLTTNQGYIFCGDAEKNTLCTEPAEDDMGKLYALISKAIPGSFKEGRDAYLSFLSDYTFRRSRGYARALCIKNEGEVSASVITSAESDRFAIISGVACDEGKRKAGYGKACVLSMVNRLEQDGKKCFVIALNESAEGFYEHIGFKKNRKISTVIRRVM